MLEAGDELTEGSVNPHDILKIKGLRATQDYMLQEVQRVYRLQGVAACCRRKRAGYRRADHAWYHKGFSGNRILPVSRFLPGDNKGSDRSSYQG